MSDQEKNMPISGKIFMFGDHVNTDGIIPARYLNTAVGGELARHLMEDVRPGFGRRDDLAGSIIVAGENFGCGSSREHAPLAIRSAGIAAVIARSFARIFLRNAINIGLPIIETDGCGGFHEGDRIEIDLEQGLIRNPDDSRTIAFPSYPPFLREIMAAGGWLPAAKKLASTEAPHE
jgi:3-isopropylmalate/(R)-2-methylmalate dehydratase small subunit